MSNDRPPAEHLTISVTVNGRPRHVTMEAGDSLLSTIRDGVGLTGAKPSCEVGTCGACTMLLDDEAIYSCLVLGAECDGRRVDTVEGLADGSSLSTLQSAFVECDALQCGFCTPGQLMSLEGLRRRNDTPSADDIEQAVQGNLCRCGAYRHILEAAEAALCERSGA